MQSGLELISTKDMLDELGKRFDLFVFSGVRDGGAPGSGPTFVDCFSGQPLGAMGLCANLSNTIWLQYRAGAAPTSEDKA